MGVVGSDRNGLGCRATQFCRNHWPQQARKWNSEAGFIFFFNQSQFSIAECIKREFCAAYFNEKENLSQPTPFRPSPRTDKKDLPQHR